MLQTYPEVYVIKKARKDLQRHKICVSDAYHYYILSEIERRCQIEYERNLHNVE